MPNPKFNSVVHMQEAALAEDDGEVNLRLRQHKIDGTSGGYVWLRVVRQDNDFGYFVDGKRSRAIEPDEAQRLIDKEWGR